MVDPVENWRNGAHYDLKAAAQMLQGGFYIYVIFFCHQSVEKMLKAVVEKMTGRTPPKTHDLQRLVKEANLKPPLELSEFIVATSRLNIPARYPLDLDANSSAYTQERAQEYLRKAQEALKWIEKSLTS